MSPHPFPSSSWRVSASEGLYGASALSNSINFLRRGIFAAAAILAGTQVFAASAPVDLNWLGGQQQPLPTGVSWGVSWAQGTVNKDQSFSLTTADGKSLPVQMWPMAYWPDGSLKWSGFATVAPGASGPFKLTAGSGSSQQGPVVSVKQSGNGIVVDTGRLVCRVPASGSNLIDSLSIDGVEVARAGRLVCIRQDGADDPDSAPARERFTSRFDKVRVEQSGPVRAVLKFEGKHRADKGDREWLPFTVRLYFYAGEQPVRVVHSIVFDGDQEKDFIRGLGLTFAVPMREQVQNRHVRFSGQDGGLWSEPIQPGRGNPAQQAGERLPNRPPVDPNDIEQVAIWSDFKLSQLTPDGFTVSKRTNPKSAWVFANAGKRASGLAFVGDVSGGLAIGVKDFWQSYPAQLDVRNAAADAAELTAWLWSPDAPAMDLRHYDIRAHGLNASYEDVQPGMSTAFGVSRTSEFTLFPTAGVPKKPDTIAWAERSSRPPLLVTTPEYLHSTGVFGVWSLPDRSTPLKVAVEDRLDSLLSFYKQQVDERYWYGFWVYGDFLHSYSRASHQWYYDLGGYA